MYYRINKISIKFLKNIKIGNFFRIIKQLKLKSKYVTMNNELKLLFIGGTESQWQDQSGPSSSSINWTPIGHFKHQFSDGHDRTAGRLRTSQSTIFFSFMNFHF